jgi:hypothetical protein
MASALLSRIRTMENCHSGVSHGIPPKAGMTDETSQSF